MGGMARAEESPGADSKQLVEELDIYLDVYHCVFHLGSV
jgi:hypothetical protein